MKRIIFSFLLSFLSLAVISQTYNLNISGTVSDEDGNPVIQREIFISIPADSLNRDFVYFNTVFTDGMGYFVENIDVPDGEEGFVIVETYGCNGGMLTQDDDYSENNNVLVFDFEVCTDSIGDCMAMFDYIQNDVPLTLAFFDLSFGNPVEWDWEFGDGATSDEQNPVHTYGDEGEYFVTLSIENAAGDCSSTIELPVYVGNDSIWYGECMAMFYYYPNDSLNSFTYNFVDVSRGFGNLLPSTWSWDFGDGTTSDEQNPTHAYSDEGEYEVCLTITSSNPATGETCEDTFCELVIVTDWENNCEAWFFYMPLGDLGMTLQFTDESWGYPTSWLWEFGDGTTSDEQNPIHEYTEEGIYNVCLSIFSDSCESTYCEDVFVYNNNWDECITWFDYVITDLTVDYTAYYDSFDSVATTATFTWDFGDGETGTGETISHTYADNGIYDVMLTAEAVDCSCTTTYYDMVWVGEDFSFSVSGNIYLEDSLFADAGNVYLMTFDTTGNGLINIATTQIVGDAGYYEFEEVGFEHCMYFIQAELTDGSAYFGDYIPTYHLSAMNWEEAWPVFPTPNGSSYNVYMIADSNVTNGDGNISGIVNSDENRSLMSEILILLQDENRNPLTYLRTDENGEFQFPELDYGTYIVYTEIVGIETTPAVVTLTQDNPTANITIIVANGEATLGVNNISDYLEEVGNVTPNPVAENARIEISIKEASTVTVSVVNQYGQSLSISENQMNIGKNEISLQTSSLPQGIYIVSIVPEDGIKTVRKFVKLR